ncbi:Protein of Unknown function [Frankineae bacterium MT45]|nr:Protein of Unknown function [Frankineae bacterium MT45]
MDVLWRSAADLVIALHFAFLVYVVIGGFVAWRWRRTIALHVLAATWALLIVTTKVACPLTIAQDDLRRRVGEGADRGGFIDTYVRGVIYSENAQSVVQIGVAILVAGSWIGFLWLARRRQPAAPPSRQLILAGRGERGRRREG